MIGSRQGVEASRKGSKNVLWMARVSEQDRRGNSCGSWVSSVRGLFTVKRYRRNRGEYSCDGRLHSYWAREAWENVGFPLETSSIA